MSSLFYGISKIIIDIYNIKKFGVANSQFAPLSENEITLIILNCKEDLNIDENGIKSLHDTIIGFIKSENYKIEKQKLKSAHWLFRKGSISNSCKVHPLISEALSNFMIDTQISRNFIKKNINISYIMKHLDEGIPCNTLEERITNITQIIEKAMSELILLKNLLDMGKNGNTDDNSLNIIQRSRNTSISENKEGNENVEDLHYHHPIQGDDNV